MCLVVACEKVECMLLCQRNYTPHPKSGLIEHNSKKTNQLKKWPFKSGPFIQGVVWSKRC